MLVDEISRLGWGDLGGREWGGIRALYRAFVSHDGVNNRTGQGRVTMVQLARHAGLGLRWTKDRVAAMEAAGLLEIDRGYLMADGTAHPSWIRVNKQAIVDMLAAARHLRDRANDALWVAARARMAKLHSIRALAFVNVRRRKEAREERLRRSLSGAVSARHSPKGLSLPPSPGGNGRGFRPWDQLATCEHDHLLGKCPTGKRTGAACGRTQH